MKQTVESKAARAILQTPIEEKIGETTYTVSPPSLGTLILVSEVVSKLPEMDGEAENILQESLRSARHCRIIGDIIAILVLGSKCIDRSRIVEKRRLFGLIRTRETILLRDEIAKSALGDMEPGELSALIKRLLGGLQVGFFFGITTSLAEANVTKPTKTTASGQS